MRKLLTLALALVTLASTFATSAPKRTGMMAQSQPLSPMRTITLNTGWDQWSSPQKLIDVGKPDNEWRVITDPINFMPVSTIATGRRADVVSDNIWGSYQAANFPNSRWISIGPNQGAPLSGTTTKFQYAFYFTLPAEAFNPVLCMKLSADDHVTKVSLNNHALFQGSGGEFFNIPPLMIPTAGNPVQPDDFKLGKDVNMITVDVEDTGGIITGLIVDGTVTYEDCDRPAIRELSGLQFITFWESTFALPTANKFSTLIDIGWMSRRSGPLSQSNCDFYGAPDLEFYDVFYSDWDGTFNLNGSCVTIEAAVPNSVYPSGGGLNISRVDLNFTNGSNSANSVMSFVVLGDNALPSNVGNAVDIDPDDHNIPSVPKTDTTMGNTIDQSQRLRLTVGFPCHGKKMCLQDESNPNTVFQADPETGAYQFSCGGTTFTGVAQITKRGNITTFQQNSPDRRVTATFDGGTFKGSASLQSPPGTNRGTITDRDTRNNSCPGQ